MQDLSPDETILGLLAAGSQHGYALLDSFRDGEQLGAFWKLSVSQLYAVLKRLDRHGWIVGQQVISESAPPRTDYAITPAGEARLQAWLYDADPSPAVRSVRVEFLSRLYIARLLSLPEASIIAYQRAACDRELARRRSQRDAMKPGVGALGIDLVIGQLETVLGWIDRLEGR